MDFGIIKTVKSDDALAVFDRSRFITAGIVAIIKKHNITKVHLEGLAFGATGNVGRDLGILQGILVSGILDAGVSPENIQIIAPTALKKFATGNGRSDKNEMFEKLPDWIKPDIETYKKTKGRSDVTDAFYLSMFGNEDYKALDGI